MSETILDKLARLRTIVNTFVRVTEPLNTGLLLITEIEVMIEEPKEVKNKTEAKLELNIEMTQIRADIKELISAFDCEHSSPLPVRDSLNFIHLKGRYGLK